MINEIAGLLCDPEQITPLAWFFNPFSAWQALHWQSKLIGIFKPGK